MNDKTNQIIIEKSIRQSIRTRQELADIKRQVAGKFKLPPPANSQLIQAYRRLVASGKITPKPELESLLKKRAVRTLSGVAVVAVLTKPYPCPGKCLYCPTEKAMPKSYLSNEPAVMRAVLCDFHPFRQVKMRLKALENNGHPTDKVELIVMGGTWTHLPRQYQNWFIKQCFLAGNINSKQAKTLKDAQKANEKARHRIVGLTLETRPDHITPEEIRRMRELGCTRVELGVQAISDPILQLNRRGHNAGAVISATKLLKDAGFKISYHMMPGLPGSTPAKDLSMAKGLFSNPDFQPDMLKIYPCVITKNSRLYEWWKEGRYKPYSNKKLVRLLAGIKSAIPPYVRISRLIRDIPQESIVAGNKILNLREIVWKEMEANGLKCQCIRCREIKNEGYEPKNVKLTIRNYDASGGKEYFLSYEDKKQDKLLAFLRLRIPGPTTNNPLFKIIPELKNAALVREVHTYGKMMPLKKRGRQATQHVGFGKKLMAEAEKIAKKEGAEKIAVISGIGVREYYRKLGYRLEGTYMTKRF